MSTSERILKKVEMRKLRRAHLHKTEATETSFELRSLAYGAPTFWYLPRYIASFCLFSDSLQWKENIRYPSLRVLTGFHYVLFLPVFGEQRRQVLESLVISDSGKIFDVQFTAVVAKRERVEPHSEEGVQK